MQASLDHSCADGHAAGVLQGLAVGAGLVAAGFAINYQFANRSTRLRCIDGGYCICKLGTSQFGIYGLLLGLWRCCEGRSSVRDVTADAAHRTGLAGIAFFCLPQAGSPLSDDLTAQMSMANLAARRGTKLNARVM
jgi:hypothetical protein